MIVVLYGAQAVLVPIPLAILLSFVLAPPVNWLERWLGRVPAVLMVVTLVFVVLGLAGWGPARQMTNLAEDLPRYRVKILDEDRGRARRRQGRRRRDAAGDDRGHLGKSACAQAGAPQPVVVAAEPVAGFPGFEWLDAIMGPLGTAGLVLALVIFMLLERRDLRDRLIGLLGHGRLTVTTKAFDEAGIRLSRLPLPRSRSDMPHWP